MLDKSNVQAYLQFLQKIEQPFRDFLIPVVRLKHQLKEVQGLSANHAPVIALLKDFPQEIDKVKVPLYFEHCVHSKAAGDAWIQEVQTRKLLTKLIKHRTQEALDQINFAPSMVSSQSKLIEALKAFEMVSKLGRKLEEYPKWNNLVSSLTTEAMNLSSVKSIPKTKLVTL